MDFSPILRERIPTEALSFLSEGELVYHLALVDTMAAGKQKASSRLWLIVTTRQVVFCAPVLNASGGYSIEKGAIPLSKVTGCSRAEANTMGGCGCSTRKVYHLKLLMVGSTMSFALAQQSEVDRTVQVITCLLQSDRGS